MNTPDIALGNELCPYAPKHFGCSRWHTQWPVLSLCRSDTSSRWPKIDLLCQRPGSASSTYGYELRLQLRCRYT
eukprot:5494729-Pleurochrysis_carterae.AAC.3